MDSDFIDKYAGAHADRRAGIKAAYDEVVEDLIAELRKARVYPDLPEQRSIHAVAEAAIRYARELKRLGETQLLEVLAYRLTGTHHPNIGGRIQEVQVTVTGDTFGSSDVAWSPSLTNYSGHTSLSLAQMQQLKGELYNRLQHEHNIVGDMAKRALRERLEKHFKVNKLQSIPIEEFVAGLPDDFSYMLDDVDVTAGLCHVFLAYWLRMIEGSYADGKEATAKKLGPAPWTVLNDAFQVAGFPYKVASPEGQSILDTYELKLFDASIGKTIYPNDLSSGEKVLLRLVAWLYNSKQHQRFPKLLLLDEPDAHLHPSMTRQFMDVIQDVLVERYKVRVIMTTHSPSTVALAPEGSVFEMYRSAPRIRPSPSKSHTIGLLTAGLVVVSANSRFVLVEDEADVEFFGAVRDILTDYGPSQDPKAIDPTPSLVFLPASVGAGSAKISGGKSVVAQWVEKLNAPPLDGYIKGAIDGDVGNTPTRRVPVLGRYSIENYFLDPLVVFGLLIDMGAAPCVSGVTISRGDEHLIRALDDAAMTAVVAAITAAVVSHLGTISTDEAKLKSVSFTNGRKVDYPTWMITRRGHDLLQAFQRAYGGPQAITPPKLIKMMQRVRMVPTELPALLRQLQA